METVLAADSAEAGTERVSDRFLDRVSIAGTTAQARAKLADLREIDIGLPIARALAGGNREWVERTLAVFAPGEWIKI